MIVGIAREGDTKTTYRLFLEDVRTFGKGH